MISACFAFSAAAFASASSFAFAARAARVFSLAALAAASRFSASSRAFISSSTLASQIERPARTASAMVEVKRRTDRRASSLPGIKKSI